MDGKASELDDLIQLGKWVRAAGLERFVRNQMTKRSARVFVPGMVEGYGEYGWIIEEDHSKTNPYYIVSDGIVAGSWFRADQFRRILEDDDAPAT